MEDQVLFGPNATGGDSGSDLSDDDEASVDGKNDEDERERLSLLDSEKEDDSDIEIVSLNDGLRKGDDVAEDDEVPIIDDYTTDDERSDCGLTDMSDDEDDDDVNSDGENHEHMMGNDEDPLFRDDLNLEGARKPDVVIQRVKPADRIQPKSNSIIPKQHMENRSLSNLSSGLMAHTPCGPEFGTEGKKRDCWSYGRCSKHFPKADNDETDATIEGYPHYRRRVTITPESKYEMPSKKKIYRDVDEDRTYKYNITNKCLHFETLFIFCCCLRWLPGYNPAMLLRYRDHINVEGSHGMTVSSSI